MRIAVLVLVALIACPRASAADVIVHARAGDSFLTYGTLFADFSTDAAFDFLKVSRDGVPELLDWQLGAANFSAQAGPLISRTFEADASGDIVKTVYEYGAGSFDMFFSLHNFSTGETRSGGFNALILESTITVMESDSDDGIAFFKLGAGLFDADIADALGVRRQTKGGTIADPWLAYGNGDPLSETRILSEGVPDVVIDVPEPGTISLLGIAGFWLLARSRRSPR